MSVPRLSAGETIAVLGDVLLPLLAKGVVARRPRVVALAERLNADGRAIRRLTGLRSRYGPGPLLLRVPGRDVALVLSPEDVHRVLVEQAELFTPANREKRSTLSHFQPRGVLVSEGLERAARREFNEAVLDTTRPLHRLAGDLAARAHEEGDAILENARRSGTLTWDLFAAGWWRLVRRVVLGDGARDDHAVTDTLTRLRRDANWAYLKPRRRAVYRSLYQRLAYHIARAEPGSLASLIGPAPNSPVTAPRDQVAHWLFAFDAAGMASFTALALLDTHADYARRVRDALSAREPFASEALPLLSAAVLESCGSGRQPRPSFARRRRRRCGRTASCRAAPQSSSSRRSSTATPSGFPGPTASHRKSGSTVAAAGAGRSFPSAMVPPRVQAETSSCFSRARCWQRCWSAMSSARPRLGHWIAPAPCRRR